MMWAGEGEVPNMYQVTCATSDSFAELVESEKCGLLRWKNVSGSVASSVFLTCFLICWVKSSL